MQKISVIFDDPNPYGARKDILYATTQNSFLFQADLVAELLAIGLGVFDRSVLDPRVTRSGNPLGNLPSLLLSTYSRMKSDTTREARRHENLPPYLLSVRRRQSYLG